MAAEHQRVGIGVPFDEFPAGPGSQFRIAACAGRSVRLGNLERLMEQVAGDDRLLPSAAEQHAAVARRVAGRMP